MHPSFPRSPYAILDPGYRWFPAAEDLRKTAYEKLLPPLVAKVREEVSEWRANGYPGTPATSRALRLHRARDPLQCYFVVGGGLRAHAHAVKPGAVLPRKQRLDGEQDLADLDDRIYRVAKKLPPQVVKTDFKRSQARVVQVFNG